MSVTPHNPYTALREFHDNRQVIDAGGANVPDKLILRLVNGELTTIKISEITLIKKFIAFFRGDFSLKKIAQHLNKETFQTDDETKKVDIQAALKTLNTKIEKQNENAFFKAPLVNESVNTAAQNVINKKPPPSPNTPIPTRNVTPQKPIIPPADVSPTPPIPTATAKVIPPLPNIPSPPSYVPSPSPIPTATAKVIQPPSDKSGLINSLQDTYTKPKPPEATQRPPIYEKTDKKNYPSQFYTKTETNELHRGHTLHTNKSQFANGQFKDLSTTDDIIKAYESVTKYFDTNIRNEVTIIETLSIKSLEFKKQISSINRKISAIHNNNQLSPQTKKAELEALRAQRDPIIKNKEINDENLRKASENYKPLLHNKEHVFFNIHDTDFQNYALEVCSDPERWKQIKQDNAKDSLPADNTSNVATPSQRIFRARNYAISTRDDIDWNGEKITDKAAQKAKKELLDANASSLVLYDWGGIDDTKLDKTPGSEKTLYEVVESTTQKAVETLQKKYPNNKNIAWLNMANAHRVGGGYQTQKGTQEENTIVACDAAPILGNKGFLKGEDQRIHYNPGCHIPPGGNYFHKTRFFTEDPPIDCYSIVHAVADFRQHSPESEYNDYPKHTIKDTQGKDRITINPNSTEYQTRIELDMRSILRTAKIEGMEILVLGATGCGAFQHDPKAEAKAWTKVLQETEFQGHFKEVQFAIPVKDIAQTFRSNSSHTLLFDFS